MRRLIVAFILFGSLLALGPASTTAAPPGTYYVMPTVFGGETTCVMAPATRSGSWIDASGTNPTPPGPTSVTNRVCGSARSATTASVSRSRPTNDVSGTDREAGCSRPIGGRIGVGSGVMRASGADDMDAPLWNMSRTIHIGEDNSPCQQPMVRVRSRI